MQRECVLTCWRPLGGICGARSGPMRPDGVQGDRPLGQPPDTPDPPLERWLRFCREEAVRGPDAAMCPICFCDTDPVLVLDCCNNHICVHCANVWCWNSSHGCPYCRKRTKNLQDMFARRE